MDINRRIEKIYDRCAYKGCNNGKSTGHHLFKFPAAKDPRHRIWIENSSEKDDKLRFWSASTLRRAGLCRVHFAPQSFVIGNDAKLIPQAIPLSLNRNLVKIKNLDDTVEHISENDHIELQNHADNPVTSSHRSMDMQDRPCTEGSGVAASKESGNCQMSIVKVSTAEILATALKRIAHLQKVNITLKTENDVLHQGIRRLTSKLKRVERILEAKRLRTIKQRKNRTLEELHV